MTQDLWLRLKRIMKSEELAPYQWVSLVLSVRKTFIGVGIAR